MASGDSGAAIVPGEPDQSHLLERVRPGEMPPGKDAERLSADEIALIARWMSAGAETARPEPDNLSSSFYITDEERQFWSFQPVRRPDVPTPQHAERARTPIDAFLLARLEEHDSSFADEANKRTLIRRAYFDLIGLPPSPEEVEAFLSDDADGAYGRLIDHLLESPHYGERWWQHWLDIAG